MTTQDEGLTDKFKVERTDPEAQERHADCFVFVLDPAHDPLGHTALALYADLADANGYPGLAVGIRQKLAGIDADGVAMELNPRRVDYSLRQVIAHADYDLHKGLEGDETGEDGYPELVEKFIEAYRA